MIRLIGAITGSALALATLLVLVGVPQFKATPNDIERSVVTLPLRTETVADIATTEETSATPTATEVPDDEVADLIEESPEAPAVKASVQAMDDTPIELPPEAMAEATIEVSTEQLAVPVPVDTQQWFAFWSPFRSELAASGFVAQLQRVTGLDYRVVKVKPGKYEVAFSYADETDIPLNLSQISAATGLELPES
jgi:hypothetical protein